MFIHSDPPEHWPRNVFFTPDELEYLANYWIARLGLQAWKIEVNVKRMVDMEDEGRQGEVLSTHSIRQATVNLLDPRDHRSSKHHSYDMETTLVHELLHLVLSAWDKDTVQRLQHSRNEVPAVLVDVCIEQPIEQLSMTLVALRRASEPKSRRMGVYND